MLELIDIDKRFGGTDVLRAVSLTVRPGEFFSLLGPSGCGKSTLLRIIGGFEAPDRGLVRLAGEDVTARPPHQRETNMVFQRYALFPHLDVEDNVAFGPRARGLAPRECRARVAEALALVAMTGFEKRRVTTLSGGQQQRVAMARALASQPKVLLLDEPLSALDLKLRQHMQGELRALQRRLGLTFVFVTHAQDEALALSDRLAVMREGRVEQVGTPREIYDEPRTPFVANFIGAFNRLVGRVSSRPGGDRVSLSGLGGREFQGRLAPGHDPRLGETATLLVRPERLSLARDAAAIRLGNQLRGTTGELVFKGEASSLAVYPEGLGGGAWSCQLPRTEGSEALLGGPGDPVVLGWSAEASLVMAGEVLP